MYRVDRDRAVVNERGLAPEQVYVPGGFFLGWIVENELGGPAINAADAAAFARRELSGPRLFSRCGGVIDETTLGPHALAFAAAYLAQYWDDMAEEFPLPSIFDVRDTWHNYEWMRIRLVARYSEWRSAGVGPAR